ncbi:hypothetical protein J7L87_02055 [bacterium]|nr:hypothetical protein [bacterium]
MDNVFRKLISWISQIITFFLRTKREKEYKENWKKKQIRERESAIREPPELQVKVEKLAHEEVCEEPYEVAEAKEEKPTDVSTWELAEAEESTKYETSVVIEEASTEVTAEEKVVDEIVQKVVKKTVEKHKAEVQAAVEAKGELQPKKEGKKKREDISNKIIEEKRKTKKPRIKKQPTEQEEKTTKSIGKKKRLPRTRRKEIDLGRTWKKTMTKHVFSLKSNSSKTLYILKKSSSPPQRVLSPYIEINFDESKVFLVLPKQVLNSDVVDISSKKLEYKLEINGKKERIFTKASVAGQIIEIEKTKIEVKEPIRSFTVIFPKEINERTYKYEHEDKAFYVFILNGNSGKMYYLYNENGKMNPLPKRDVWFLLNEDFELLPEPDLIVERWIWEKYQPLKINLKERSKVIIRDKKTHKKKEISCEPTFTFDNQNAIFDDFGEQSPIFTDNNIKIIAPRKDSSGWVIWVQNKIAGSKLIRDNWTGNEPFKLNPPDDLPCECGEFQLDICEQKGESIATLFFRYLPSLQLNYTKELIIPQPSKSHKEEKIEIILENPQKYDLKASKKITLNQQGFCIVVPRQDETTEFSISIKEKPETMTNVKITIPRLKWRSSQQQLWKDKPLKIKREDLIPAEDFHIFVRTNSPIKYNISAILESNGNKIQESKFVRKGANYSFLLNQFYDTIKKNKDNLTLKINIEKDKQIIGEVPIIFFLALKTVSRKFIPIPKISYGKPIVKGSKGIRAGKGFSKGELLKAGIEMRDMKHLNIPYDKRRKTIHWRNIETLKALTGGGNNDNRSD